MEERANNAKTTLNHTIATVGLGLLLIWWGVVVIIGPLTLGIGAIGTGLILLGINLIRLLSGIPTYGSTTAIGIIALVLGTLDTIFHLSLEATIALLLIAVGLAVITSLTARSKTV